ncbi:type II toxin-antitoxin system RelE/ParE family toxin [Azospirillum sp. sgz302134]
MRIVSSPRARKDIQDHFTYIGLRDEVAAERFLDAVNHTFLRLAEHPDIGSTRLWRNPALHGIRAWPVAGHDRHIVYYRRQSSDSLRILRVLHGAVPPEGVLRTPD